MAYGVIIPLKVMASNVDTLNRSGVHATLDRENGDVVRFDSMSSTTDETEVWTATQITTGAGLTNIWMIYNPELVNTTLGSGYVRGLDPDPRNFINKATKVFAAFKPQVGDMILMSADAFDNAKDSNTYAVATDQKWQLVWGGAAVSGLSLKYVDTQYINIPAGTVGDTQRVTAYRMTVTAVA